MANILSDLSYSQYVPQYQRLPIGQVDALGQELQPIYL